MAFARKVWKLLVAIKDGLVLLFMLLFFGLLYAALSLRPAPAQVKEGALLVSLDGIVVEEPQRVDTLSLLFSGAAPVREHRARDVVRAIEGAANDDEIKAVVLDLGYFLGGGQATLARIGTALDKVRASGKPVLSYGLFYADDGMQIASHASEIWLDPMGGTIVAGPGGSNLYYKGLIDRLKVDAHIYRVGTYKSAVEPYMLNGPSDASLEASKAIYGALWSRWKAEVAKNRPKADIAAITSDPASLIRANGGQAQAALAAGLVDKIGSREQFAERVAAIAGRDPELPRRVDAYAHTGYETWAEANPIQESGKPVGVITIAGTIRDGEGDAGVAAADSIAGRLDDALDKDLAALVVRIDSPGGTVTGGERIRQAILRHKDSGIPIVVSMGNLAASAAYWISMPATTIFAEPETITGSIGVFAVVPSFERTLGDIGVNAGGVRTTPLSGQPDIVGGFSPEIDALMQAQVDTTYARFLDVVQESRKIDRARLEEIAEGRVWDGGTARQIGLVDRFGGLDDALAFAAKQAGLRSGEYHPLYLDPEPDFLTAFLDTVAGPGDDDAQQDADLFALLGARRAMIAATLADDVERLFDRPRMEARCLECPMPVRSAPVALDPVRSPWLALLAKIVGTG